MSRKQHRKYRKKKKKSPSNRTSSAFTFTFTFAESHWGHCLTRTGEEQTPLILLNYHSIHVNPNSRYYTLIYIFGIEIDFNFLVTSVVGLIKHLFFTYSVRRNMYTVPPAAINSSHSTSKHWDWNHFLIALTTRTRQPLRPEHWNTKPRSRMRP